MEEMTHLVHLAPHHPHPMGHAASVLVPVQERTDTVDKWVNRLFLSELNLSVLWKKFSDVAQKYITR